MVVRIKHMTKMVKPKEVVIKQQKTKIGSREHNCPSGTRPIKGHYEAVFLGLRKLWVTGHFGGNYNGVPFTLYERQTTTRIHILPFFTHEVTNKERPMEENEDESHKDPQSRWQLSPKGRGKHGTNTIKACKRDAVRA